MDVLAQLSSCRTGTSARNVLNKAFFFEDDNQQKSFFYDSLRIPVDASSLTISDAELAIQTNIRNKQYTIYDVIDLNGNSDSLRTSSSLLTLTILSSTLSALLQSTTTFSSLPDSIRFILSWLITFSPFVFIGFGLTSPDKLQSKLKSLERIVFPMSKKRMVHHEAGHFLMGYLLGYPIREFRMVENGDGGDGAVEFYPLNDSDVGMDRAKRLGFDVKGNAQGQVEEGYYEKVSSSYKPFYSQEGRGSNDINTRSVFRDKKDPFSNPMLRLPSKDDSTKSWPYRPLNTQTLDILSAISVAGICSEILSFGNSMGGVNDLDQLRLILLNNSNDQQQDVKKKKGEVEEQLVDRRIRYAFGYTMSQLRLHLDVLDVLIDVMEKGGSVQDCILAIETCRQPTHPIEKGSEYERLRRNQILGDGSMNFLERIFVLGTGKNVDDEEDGLTVEGLGGGYRLRKFEVTGDDPFYAALGIALVFFIWASSGGLSLH